MPRKHKQFSLSELRPEPMARNSATTCWITRSPVQFDSEEVREAIDSLPPKERYVIQHRFGIEEREETLDAIGRSLGFTRERARQLEQSALAKIRKRLVQ